VDQEPKPPAQPYDYERMRVSLGRPEEPPSAVTDGQTVAPPVESTRRRKSVVREYVEAIAIAILLALVIRTLIVQAAWMVSGGDAANQNAAAGVGPDASMAPPGASGPGAPPSTPPPMPPGMPPLPGMPMDPHPQAAFAPQAMNLSPFG